MYTTASLLLHTSVVQSVASLQPQHLCEVNLVACCCNHVHCHEGCLSHALTTAMGAAMLCMFCGPCWLAAATAAGPHDAMQLMLLVLYKP